MTQISSMSSIPSVPNQDNQPSHTGVSLGAVDSSGSISAFSRTIAGAFPVASSLLSAPGASTAFSIVSGPIATVNAADQFNRKEGAQKHDAAIDFVRGLAQSAGGASFALNRPLTLASTITNASANSLLGRASLWTGSIGGACFGVLYASFTAIFSRKIFRLSNFESKMQKQPPTDIGISKFLVEKRLKEKTPSETLEKLLEKSDIKTLKPLLQKKALDAVAKDFSSLLKEASRNGIDTLGLVQRKGKEYATMFFNALNANKEVKGATVADMGLSGSKEGSSLNCQELMGLELMCAARNQKKEIKLSECIGPKAMALAKNAIATKLIDRLGSNDKMIQEAAKSEAEELVNEAKKGIASNKRNNWAVLCTCFFGVLSTVASFFPLVGIAYAVEQMVNLGIYLTMLIMDWTGLKSAQQVESGPIGKHDKTILGVHTALCLSAIAATIVVGSIFSMGILPVAVAGTIGALWLANNIVAYVKLIQKERAYKIAHPTLSDVKEVLSKLPNQESTLDDKTKAMFKRLSTDDKKAVKKYLLGDANDLRKLSDADQKLNDCNTFGEEYVNRFTSNPKDEFAKKLILRAAEKAFEKTGSVAMCGLIEILKSEKFDENNLKKVIENLSIEDKKVLFENVYNKRARKESSRNFDEATIKKIVEAIDKRIKQKEFDYKELLRGEVEKLNHMLSN